MGGVWVGYLYGFVVCGVVIGLVASCTLTLYLIARFRRPEPNVRVLDARKE
jgi:hypothetical protein